MADVRVGVLIMTTAALVVSVIAGDNNHAYSPCRDTTVQRHDGFTLGLAFAGKSSFYSSSNTSVQLSPCDKRLSLSNSNAQLAVFRPKVDEISLLTVNSSTLSPESYGAGYMVAFAGSKYAARSPLAFVANGSYVVTSFTLVLEFKKGRLNNLYWKRDSCASCKGNSNFVCLNGQDCAIPLNDCKSHNGKADCSLGIQLAFSGTDKHYEVLNSCLRFFQICCALRLASPRSRRLLPACASPALRCASPAFASSAFAYFRFASSRSAPRTSAGRSSASSPPPLQAPAPLPLAPCSARIQGQQSPEAATPVASSPPSWF